MNGTKIKKKIHYRILTPIPPSFIKSLNVLLLTIEYPNENGSNGSQCNFQKNAPNAKHRLCIKLMKVAKSYIKQNPCKRKEKDKVCMHLAVDMWHWNNPRIHLSSNKQKM